MYWIVFQNLCLQHFLRFTGHIEKNKSFQSLKMMYNNSGTVNKWLWLNWLCFTIHIIICIAAQKSAFKQRNCFPNGTEYAANVNSSQLEVKAHQPNTLPHWPLDWQMCEKWRTLVACAVQQKHNDTKIPQSVHYSFFWTTNYLLRNCGQTEWDYYHVEAWPHKLVYYGQFPIHNTKNTFVLQRGDGLCLVLVCFFKSLIVTVWFHFAFCTWDLKVLCL